MKNHMSVSQFGKWMDCESMALAYCRGDYVQETTDAMLVGSYLDAVMTTDGEQFKIDHPEMFKKTGDKGLLAKYSIVEDMLAAIEGDEVFMAAMDGEKQVTIERELYGVQWIAKLDVINHKKKFITDLKTTRDFALTWHDEYRKKVPFYEAWNYWRQMAAYQELAKLEFGAEYQLYIAAVTKQSPPDKMVLRFDQNEWRLNFERGVLKNYMRRVKSIKSGEVDPTCCGLCEWCRLTKKAKITTAESVI